MVSPQTVAIIAEGDLANAVMQVGLEVTGDALLSLWQDGDQLAARGGVTMSSTSATARARC